MSIPELPRYRAEWRPLYFETIPGSGERFTFAIVARGMDGKTDVRDTLRPNAMRAIFGPQGDVMYGLMVRGVVAIKRAIDNGVDWREAPMILSNMQPGPIRETLAENFEQVFDQAIRLCASLGSSTIGVQENGKINHDLEIASWAGRIKSFVEVMHGEMAKNFNLNIREGESKAIKTRIGFRYGSYAANFGVLHTRSDRISADITSIKRKLWDLDRLRDNNIDPPRRTEIIVGHAPLELISGNKKLLSTLHNKLHILQREAAQRDIGVFETSDVRTAADHIIQMAVAA
jgi:hypothetical protein